MKPAWLAARAFFAIVAIAACGARSSATTSNRIVSQVVFADEELWAFGPDVQSRVVGVSPLVDDARYSDVANTWPTTVARAAGVEGISALAPDLVITAEFTSPETRAMLEQLGVRTIELAGWRGFADYRRHTAALADAVDAEARGAERVAAFDARLAELEAQRRADAPRPTIVSWQDGVVAGAGTSFDDAANAAGFTNLAATRGVDGHAELGVETLAAWDPEVLVVPCEGDCATRQAEVAARPGIRATRAGTRGHVVAVEGHHLYSTGFAMLDLVARLVELRRSMP